MLHAAGLSEVTGTTAKDLKDHQDHELVAGLLAYRAAKGEERERRRDEVLALAPEKAPAPAPPWNFGSPQQVAEIVETILGECLENTSESELLKHVNEHPFFSALLDYRKLKKRATTYGEGWFKDAYDETRGRVRPGWRQIGSSTGRFACSEPNAQNLPNEGPYRSFFVAPPGRTFVDVDYSQIEVRIIAKLLEEEALLELYERDEDVYRATAANMLDITTEEVTKPQRQLAKALVLGMLYGLSAFGLPNYAFKNYGIKMSPEEAKDYVEAFYELYPKIAEYHATTRAEFYKKCDSPIDRQTLTGRRRDGITVINEAINMPIQGTAADGLKMAMARVHERLRKFDGTAFIIATIHDELLIECDEGDAVEILGIVEEAMVEAMDELVNADEPKVPIKVEGQATKIWSKD
jgi:DNA polymerase-1